VFESYLIIYTLDKILQPHGIRTPFSGSLLLQDRDDQLLVQANIVSLGLAFILRNLFVKNRKINAYKTANIRDTLSRKPCWVRADFSSGTVIFEGSCSSMVAKSSGSKPN